MKKTSLITAGLIAAGLVSQALANNTGTPTQTVYVTGSTAFRGNVYNALKNQTFDSAPTITTYGQSIESKGVYMVFRGFINSVDVAVNCFWSGSEAGIAALTPVSTTTAATLNDGNPLAGVPCTFINAADVTGNSVPGTGTAAPPSGSILEGNTQQPDLSFADTSKAVSLTTGSGITDKGIVGIVPFTFLKGINSTGSSSAWGRIKNISDDQLFFFFSSPVSASFLDGEPGDYTTQVYPVGRNKGSGTRVNTLIEANYGITKGVTQYGVNSTVENNPTSGLYGLTYVSNPGHYVLASVGDNGYETGSDVANALNVDSTGQTFGGNPLVLVGYASTSDAGSVSTGPATASGSTWLTLNGVPESDGAVEYGSYSFWGHEHLYGRTGGDRTTTVTSVANLVINGLDYYLENNDASPKTLHGTYTYVTLQGHGGTMNAYDNSAVDPLTLTSSGINNQYMLTDKGSGSDTGLPAAP